MSGVWLSPLVVRQKIDGFFKSGADDFAIIRAFFYLLLSCPEPAARSSGSF